MNHKKLPMSGQQSLTVLKKDMPASRYDGRLTWPRRSFHRRDRRCPGSLSSCQDRLAPATSKIHWLKNQKLILKLSESVIYQAVESLIFFFWVSKGDEATHIRDINEEQWGKRVNLQQLAEAATSLPYVPSSSIIQIYKTILAQEATSRAFYILGLTSLGTKRAIQKKRNHFIPFKMILK